MGTSIVTYILGAMLTFLIINNNIIRINSEQSTLAIGQYKSTQGRNLSNAVVSMLASKISTEPTFRSSTFASVSLFEGDAYYRVVDTLVATDSLIKIEVIGRFTGETIVQSAYFRKATSSQTVPTAFTYALATQGNLSLSGNAAIVDDGSPSTNANVHVNGSVAMSGSAKIEGFLTYSNSFSGSTSKVVPNSNPQSLPVTSKTSAIEVPEFNPDDYIAKATTVYSGNLNVTGALTLGTATNPAIIYVGGNLTMSGNTSITGYGIVIVKGNVQMSGNTVFNTLDPGTSTFGLYAAGNVQISGTSDFYGQLLSLSNIQISGTSNIHGTMASSKDIQMSGNNKVYYRSASAKLTTPVFSSGAPSSRVRFAYYYE